jgi:hypothetical protein
MARSLVALVLGAVAFTAAVACGSFDGNVAVDATHVWWTVGVDKTGGLYRAPKAGGPTEVVVPNLDDPIHVVLDDAYAYVTVNGDDAVLRVSETRQ